MIIFFLNLGSNILLQRLMIQNNDIQQICLFTFDSEMNPCSVYYVILKFYLGKKIKFLF